MKEKLKMTSRLCVLVAALGLAACGGNTTPPYSIATSPTVWISYPTDDDTSVCLSDNGQNEFPVHFTAFNAPANAVVRIRMDRHLSTTPGGCTGPCKILGLTNTSPFVVANATVGEHLIDVEIVNADGSALTAAQTKNQSHKFQALIATEARTVVVSGTSAEGHAACESVVECTADSECDPADPESGTPAQTCVEGTCTLPE